MNMSSAVSVAFDPLLSWTVLAVLGGIGLLLVLAGLRAGARGALWRLGAVAVVLAALSNPSLVEEKRKPIADVVQIMVDDSDSMSIGDRRQQVQAAREMLKRKFGQEQGLEVREAVLPPSHIQLGSERPGGTRLIEAMRSALVDVPPERLAGVVLLTDGQVHDVPPALPPELGGAPLHALIAGKKGERDRLITVEQAPRFGVVGHQVTAKFKVDDPAGGTAPVTVTVGGEVVRRMQVPVGKPVELPLTVTNPGENIVELETAPGPSELTLDNNRAIFTINGVRDRLRVLLVSGEPYQGERAWRNLLKSDPAVDLVHFTILRTPQKDDFTPVRELSLIVFPMRELFEQKLKEFDLIIFDRYESGNLITREYFRNIADYVKEGGALLVSVGPVFATQRSLYRSPLGAILPASPTGDVLEQGFKPKVTDIGRRHPVTADLPQEGAPGKEPQWGRWFRVVTSHADRGHTILSGANDQPLVVLDRVGKGRVAEVLSDQLWLWNRGIDGGGPQPELVRRTAHWLMKEPDLEEEALRAKAVGGHIEITRRTLAATFPDVTMTAPGTPPTGGAQRKLKLTEVEPGLGRAVVDVDKPGLYRFDDGTLRTVAAVGNPDPLEFSDVRATDQKLKSLVEASNGALIWLSDHPNPEIRSVRPGRAAGGTDWIGLRRNEGYTVTGINQTPLLPGILVAVAFLLALGSAWWREGR